MTMRRLGARLALSGLLFTLLLIAGGQHVSAGLGILWRSSVVSWDSPTTQLHDEAASQGATYSDPIRQALRALDGAACQRFHVLSCDGAARTPAADSRLTRSPPSH